MNKFSLVIPVFNSSIVLPDSLNRLSLFFSDKLYLDEIIFVDDGSSDESAAIIENFAKGTALQVRVIHHEYNLGKGASVRDGISIVPDSSGYVFFTDDDLPFGPEILEKMHRYFLDYPQVDMLIGDRTQSRQKNPYPLYRRIGSYFFSLLLPRAVAKDFPDTQCGLKGFRTESAKKIFKEIRSQRWSFDTEVILIAVNSGLTVHKIPVRILDYVKGTKFGMKDIYSVAREVIALRWNNWRGYYKIR